MTAGSRTVLIAAAGAAWESAALAVVERERGLLLLRRCLDVDDLLAAVTAGQADAAVVALDAPGLDAAAVEHLQRHDVGALAVLPEDAEESGRTRARRVGLAAVLAATELERLPEALAGVTAAAAAPPATSTGPSIDGAVGGGRGGAAGAAVGEGSATGSGPGAGATGAGEDSPGPVVAVWGPHGAPGRSTIASALAGLLAARAVRPLLVDADPRGGTLAQQLGVLDEVSGLLAAARLETAGDLAERWGELPRTVPPGVALVSGLPRADRWAEVRPGALEHLLALGRATGPVVVDTGADLEEDPLELGTGRPPRHGLTLAALEAADEVVVVGNADPVGLARLARALVELADRQAGREGAPAPVRVLVNRMRSTLGWSEHEITGMVEGFARVRGVHFLPDDRASVDAALVAGRGLAEQRGSTLLTALEPVADALAGPSASPRSGRRGSGAGLRPRRAGRARRR